MDGHIIVIIHSHIVYKENTVSNIFTGLPLFAPNIYQITSRDVKEGQNVKLSCTVSVTSSDPDPVTWSWTCGGEDMTVNSTTSGGASTLIFTTNRSHNEQFCYCNAKARNSLNETFDKDSIHTQIHVQCEYLFIFYIFMIYLPFIYLHTYLSI